jgi:TetR/AcrR family transcriptional regulator, cholesterol catabolism regulator
MATSGIEARRKAALEDGSASYIARRAEIIQAAARVFRDLGFDVATLRDVAEALNTDRATLYYYIGSKEELLQEIVRDSLARDVRVAEAVKRSRASSHDKIRTLIKAMVDSYVETYPLTAVYMEDFGRVARQDSEWATDVIARTRKYQSLVRSIMEKGRRDGTLRADLPVDLSSLALFGMVNWMHRWYRPGPGVKWTPEDVTKTITEIFLGGYGIPAEAPEEPGGE